MIRTLVVTSDTSLVVTFTQACEELGVEVSTNDGNDGIPEELGHAKFEGVLVDFDTVCNLTSTLAAIRRSPANRNAVTFAVATKADDRRQARANGVNFLFNRPFDAREIRRVLDGAFDLMICECRRYFRCVAEIPVLLTKIRSGTDCKCMTMNLSSGGMAIKGHSSLIPSEEIHLAFSLPGADAMVRATGVVIWDDKHGKTGISFRCASAEHQADLDSWLDAQFHLQRVSAESNPHQSQF